MAGIHPEFIQEGPQLENAYESDALLKLFLKSRFSAEEFASIEPDLRSFGEKCAGEFLLLADQAESEPPAHIAFDPWGRRIDDIKVSAAWNELHRISAREGLIAIGYERKQGALSRLYQFAKLYLFHPSSAFYTCPLAMTDGAARVLELFGSDEMKARAFRALTSRNPDEFWTSGQWMTERTGGSDVSRTSTIARAFGDQYALYGDKWFTSATTSQMAMALAKIEGATDSREGLSLFYVELRDDEGRLRKIRINRLKDKLGTHALPTAELTLEGTPGELVGGVGEGVKTVASLLNITRLYNSCTSLGAMSRALHLAKDYARRRSAFGKTLCEQPLHLETLAEMQAEFEGCFLMGFHLIGLLGRDETGEASPEERAILRMLTPVMKLWSAKTCIAVVSEALEAIGGAGYIEDTGLPRLLRDSQVFSIWEGTTNVLSLDALRALAKEQALAPFMTDVSARLARVKNPELAREIQKVSLALNDVRERAMQVASASTDAQQAGARAFAFALARIYAGSLVLEFAEAVGRANSVDIARRFFRRPLVNFPPIAESDLPTLSRTVYGS